MLFVTNPKGMTSPVIPLINFSIMGSSSVVYLAGGGGGMKSESDKQLSNISPMKFKSRSNLVCQPSTSINKDGINRRRCLSSFAPYF